MQAPPDMSVRGIQSAIDKIMAAPGGRPTAHDLAASAACRKLAANASDFLALCVGYETKRKKTMKAIASLNVLEDLEDVEGDEADDARNDATQFLNLNCPRRGEYQTKWIAAQIKHGYMDPPAPPVPLPEDPAVVVARAREARVEALAEIRKGPEHAYMQEFLETHARGPWPTHSFFTGRPFQSYKPAAPDGDVPRPERPERTLAAVAASKAAMTSRLQAVEDQRKAELESKAAREALEWGTEEVPKELQEELQSRFEKQQQAAQKNALSFGEESEAVFLQQAMLASYETNSAGDVNPEMKDDAPTKGPARGCLRKRKSAYSNDGEAGSSTDHAKMARRNVAFGDAAA